MLEKFSASALTKDEQKKVVGGVDPGGCTDGPNGKCYSTVGGAAAACSADPSCSSVSVQF